MISKILISAPSSSSGKTTVVCAISQLLSEMKTEEELSTRPSVVEPVETPLSTRQELSTFHFPLSTLKLGPDFIDSLFHGQIFGAKTGNIDLFFTDEETSRNIFEKTVENCDFAIIEGAMGYFDGVGGNSIYASAFHAANVLDSKVILVVDVRGKSLSVCAEILGFVQYEMKAERGEMKVVYEMKTENGKLKDEENLSEAQKTFSSEKLSTFHSPLSTRIVGVILNRCSSNLYEKLAPKIRDICGIEVLGYLENNPDFEIKSRHLGLVTPDAVENIKEKIRKIAECARNTIDLERIIKLCEVKTESGKQSEMKTERGKLKEEETLSEVQKTFSSNPKFSTFNSQFSTRSELSTFHSPLSTRIAVAYDSAFCFYYRENLELLKSFGAELCFFSPLKNEAVPQNCSALYIGGGYPELFPFELAENKISADSIRAFSRSGAPVFAECGGFLYLQLLGILKGSFENKKHLVRFGYAEFTCDEDNFLLKKGEKIRGHEFHYFDTTENGSSFIARKPDGKNWSCIQVASPVDTMKKSCCQKNSAFEKNIVAGFPHFYFPSNPKIAENFVNGAIFFESMKISQGSSSGCSGCKGCGGCGTCSKK